MDYQKLLSSAIARMNLDQLLKYRDQLQDQLDTVELRITELTMEVTGDG